MSRSHQEASLAVCLAVLRGDSGAQTPAWCLTSTAVVSASGRLDGKVCLAVLEGIGCTDSSLVHHRAGMAPARCDHQRHNEFGSQLRPSSRVCTLW